MAVVLTLVQTKQMINIRKKQYKNTVETYKTQ